MRGALNEADRHDRDRAAGRKSFETPSGSDQRSGPLADYYPLILQAVSRLETNTAETRGKIYDRARTTMLLRSRGMTPSLTESDALREQLALEKAIKKVESESLHHLGAPTQPSPRSPLLPSGPVKDTSDTCAVANDAGARTTAVGQDDDRTDGDPTFAQKLVSKPVLSVEPEHLQDQIGHYTPRSAAQKQGMMRFYVSDDVENDVRRCIRSWEHQHSISVNGRTVTGKTKCFSGTVQAVTRAPGLASGELWLVAMRESKSAPGLFDAASELQQRASR
jgi:hypothetical protein